MNSPFASFIQQPVAPVEAPSFQPAPAPQTTPQPAPTPFPNMQPAPALATPQPAPALGSIGGMTVSIGRHPDEIAAEQSQQPAPQSQPIFASQLQPVTIQAGQAFTLPTPPPTLQDVITSEFPAPSFQDASNALLGMIVPQQPEPPQLVQTAPVQKMMNDMQTLAKFDDIGPAFAASVNPADEKTATFDPSKYMMKVQGGALYLPAQARIKWFRTENPTHSIVTECIGFEPFTAGVPGANGAPAIPAKGMAKYRCTISDPSGRVLQTATRTEFAWRKGPMYDEIAETGSVGRACQMLGYGTILDDESGTLADASTPDGTVVVSGTGNPFAK